MKNRGWWILLLLILLAVPGYFLWKEFLRPVQPDEKWGVAPASYVAAPSFRLTDQTGQPFDGDSLNGKVWVADFIFTRCAGSCPLMTQKMAGLQATLPPEVALVSFSVDPAYDTPAVLKRYGKQWGAVFPRWRFLTGPEPEIARLTKDGFRLSYAEGTDPAEPVIHSIRFVLIDKTGVIRGYYDSTDPAAMAQLTTDVASLLAANR